MNKFSNREKKLLINMFRGNFLLEVDAHIKPLDL